MWGWYQELRRDFPWRFLVLILCGQGILKGLVGGGGSAGWLGTPLPYLYRRIGGIPASRMQNLRAAAAMPWGLKPVMGSLSDLVSVCGWHKLPYMLVTGLGATVSAVYVGLGWPLSAISTTSLLFVLFWNLATVDLLVEAAYAARLRVKPEAGPSLLSFLWGSLFALQLISILTVGPIMQYLGIEWPYVFAAVPMAAFLLPVLLNYLGEERDRRSAAERWQHFSHNRQLVLLSVVMTLSSLALVVVGILVNSPGVVAATAAAQASLLLLAFTVLLSGTTRTVMIFFFLQACSGISIDGAAYFFFTDNAAQYPEGPHFSVMFYTTAMGAVSAAFSCIGVILYKRFMSKWKYRKVLTFNNVILVVVNLLTVVVFKRWNKKLHIPDRVFILGADAFQQLVNAWAWIPSVVLVSQMCPKASEALTFSVLDGGMNLGTSIAQYFGAFLLSQLGVRPSGALAEGKQFDRLWIAALLSAVAPLVPLLFIQCCIPDASQVEHLHATNEEQSSAQVCEGDPADCSPPALPEPLVVVPDVPTWSTIPVIVVPALLESGGEEPPEELGTASPPIH